MSKIHKATASETIELPADVHARVAERVPYSGFDTVDEYAAFVIEEVVERVEGDTDADAAPTVDESEVEARLEALGYRE